MKVEGFLSKNFIKKAICVVVLLAIAIVSMFVISKQAASPENYRSTIESIDDKKATVMGITATAATASTVLASIPGDVTTPIANQIMEVSSYLLIVVCALVLEKSLLTVLGYISFAVLIPIACLLLGICVFKNKEKLKVLAIKIVILALALVLVIPFSIKVSDLIYEANRTTIEQVSAEIDENITEDEEKSWLEKALDKLKDGVTAAGEKAKQIMNSFIDAIAIFIITYCAIPILVLLSMCWFVKLLFGVNIPLPQRERLEFIKNKIKLSTTKEIKKE